MGPGLAKMRPALPDRAPPASNVRRRAQQPRPISGNGRRRFPAWARAIPTSGYAPKAPIVALVILAIASVRLHEIYPPLMKLRPAMIASVAGLAYVFRNTALAPRISMTRDPSFRLILAFIAWCAITVPFAYWPGGAYKQLSNTFLASAPVVLALLLCAPTRVALTELLLGGTIAVSFYGMALLAIGEVGIQDRASLGISLDSNDIAAMLAMWMPFAIGIFLRKQGLARWVGLGSAVVFVLGIAATGSRGGTLALVAGSLTFAAGYRGHKFALILSLLVVGGAAGWTGASPTYRQRIVDLVEGKEDYNSTDYAGRKAIWIRARQYAIDHPLLGVGMGNFSVAEGKTLEAMGHRGKWSVAHNAYFHGFAELGFPGGLLFCSLLALTGRRALYYWRQPRQRTSPNQHMPELLAALVGFAIGSVFLSTTYASSTFALAAIIALADRVFIAERLEAAQAKTPPAVALSSGT